MTRVLVSETAAAIATAASAALACAPSYRLPTPSIAGDTAPVTVIPFELYDGRVNVRATINGDSGWLVLDTGAWRTTLDSSWALQVGVQLPWTRDSNHAVVDAIRLGTLTLRNYVVDLYDMHDVSAAAGRFQAGLLGHDFLRHFTVEVDYGEQIVRLYDRATYRYEGAGVILPFASKYDSPLLRVSFRPPGGDWVKARLLLDTGSGRLCLILMTPFVEKHHLTTMAPAVDGPLITGIAGPLHVAVGSIAAFRLGELALDSVPTGLGRERKSFLTSKGIDGLAGSRLFHGGRLILDYYRHRAIVEPAAGVGRDCRYDQSGLTLTARGADYRDFRVGYVVPHSPAADVGIQEGDRILAIDGRSSAEVELPDLRRALAVDSTARQLRLLRGADTLVVTVKLRRLF